MIALAGVVFGAVLVLAAVRMALREHSDAQVKVFGEVRHLLAAQGEAAVNLTNAQRQAPPSIYDETPAALPAEVRRVRPLHPVRQRRAIGRR